MKNLLIVATCGLCVLIISAIPVPSGESEQTKGLEILQIPLQGNKEIDILSLPENAEGQLTERNKRTIGVLRELFPELSKQVEQSIQQKVQLLLPVILRSIGPILLRSGIGGGGGGSSSSSSDDDDDDDDDDSSSGTSQTTRKGNDGRKVSISLPTFPPDDEDEDEDEDNDTSNSNNKSNVDVSSKAEETVIKATPAPTSPALIRTSTVADTSRFESDENENDNDLNGGSVNVSGRLDIRMGEENSDSEPPYAPSLSGYLPPSNDNNFVRRRKSSY